MIDSQEIYIPLGEKKQIDLVGMGNAGYSWVFEIDKENIISIAHEYIVSKEPKPGERGMERFTLTGTNRGNCKLEFKQVQSWVKDQPAHREKRIIVNVG